MLKWLWSRKGRSVKVELPVLVVVPDRQLRLPDFSGSGWQFTLNRECLPVQAGAEREFDCS